MTYTIKQVSEMMSLPVSTIRYYDKMGLIPFLEMVKRGDESLEERYQLFVRRKEIVLEEMRQLEKQLETIEHKLWYYETAIKAGTEDIHKK